MRLLIDILHIRKPCNTGTVNVSLDIISGFINFSNWDIILLMWEDQEDFIEKAIGRDLQKILAPVKMRTDFRKRKSLCPSLIKKQLDNYKIDVVLTTCFTHLSFIYPRKYHQIGLVHDMQRIKIFLHSGQRIKGACLFFLSLILYHLIPNLVTISSYVNRDVKKYVKRNSVVIYNGVKVSAVEEEINTIKGNPYILDVNSFQKYKNTENLIRAFCLIKDQIPHVLYLKGYAFNQRRINELTNFVDDLGCEDRVVLDISNRTTAEMNYLYHHADLFVSPSLMEGFGLTPVEAALHKVPVIVSNIETLEEVSDGLFPTFDPKSVKSIANAMLNALQIPPSYNKLNQIAEHFNSKYSIENQIQSYITLIKKVVEV